MYNGRTIFGMMGMVMLLSACNESQVWTVPVEANLEEKRPDGSPFSPSTQSFLRGHHWLDGVNEIQITLDSKKRSTFEWRNASDQHHLKVVDIPYEQLVPRLHYDPGAEPDAFDAFNLMMAEYSRNGLSVPIGEAGDSMSHFETSLAEEVPWTLEGDFQFVPNPHLRPLRVSVVNNCLTPGLWELNAVDRAGEIYHAWFDMPEDAYYRSIAEVNGLSEAFAKEATQWKVDSIPLDLDRLRRVGDELGDVAFSLSTNERAGFSSQGSRRKLERKFALVEGESELKVPQSWRALLAKPAHLSEFMSPGVYGLEKRRIFDLSFLAQPQSAQIRRVEPLTDYDVLDGDNPVELPNGYIEMELNLASHRIVIGGLPLDLLVPAEEFVIHGFGVGILSASDFAERRNYLLADGPRPSYAYVIDDSSGQALAMNSHELGIEQLFIRTHLEDGEPWWEITITSYERIVDLVRFRVDVPKALHETMGTIAKSYVSPMYFTYRDDNLR